MSNTTTFSLKTINGKCLPTFYQDDVISSWNGNTDFNFWFFSNLGYILLKKQEYLIIDKILYDILGGSTNWLNLSKKHLFNIEIKKQSSEHEKTFIKIVILKIILNNIHSKRVNKNLYITTDFFEIDKDINVLDFYYSKYLKNNNIVYKPKKAEQITYEEACKSSKNHDGLYTSFQGIELYNDGHVPGDNIKLNTNNFESISHLSLGYLFAKFSKENKLINKIENFYTQESISLSEQDELFKLLTLI